jgi:hypothetical protein
MNHLRINITQKVSNVQVEMSFFAVYKIIKGITMNSQLAELGRQSSSLLIDGEQ